MRRKHISLKTKLASALLALGEIPYDDAKEMGEANFLSLWHFDHGILHAIDPVNYYWNLTPRLINPHREKSRKDTAVVAKVKRLKAAADLHLARMIAAPIVADEFSKLETKRKWPKIPSRLSRAHEEHKRSLGLINLLRSWSDKDAQAEKKKRKWPKIPSRPFPKKHRPLRGKKKR